MLIDYKKYMKSVFLSCLISSYKSEFMITCRLSHIWSITFLSYQDVFCAEKFIEKPWNMILQYSKHSVHMYPNVLGIKMQFYQKCSNENFELRIIQSHWTGLYLFFIKNELSIDSYYNRKKSKRLFKIIRDQTPL